MRRICSVPFVALPLFLCQFCGPNHTKLSMRYFLLHIAWHPLISRYECIKNSLIRRQCLILYPTWSRILCITLFRTIRPTRVSSFCLYAGQNLLAYSFHGLDKPLTVCCSILVYSFCVTGWSQHPPHSNFPFSVQHVYSELRLALLFFIGGGRAACSCGEKGNHEHMIPLLAGHRGHNSAINGRAA